MRVQHVTRKRIAIVEFVRWPLEKRQQFVAQEMPNSPDFIKASLLRESYHAH